MATRAEIRNDIEQTREHISFTIDEISNIVHKKIEVSEKIKENPLGSVAIAMAIGFTIATFATPIGKTILRIGMKSAIGALGAYATKKGMEAIKNKIQI